MAGLSVTWRHIGATPSGKNVTAYTLSNTAGMVMEVIDHGATVTSVKCPSASSEAEEITLCQPDLETLCNRSANPYFGATVGRYANRIADGKFAVDGSVYQLAKTFKGQHSHGGGDRMGRITVARDGHGHTRISGVCSL
jgi:aldose 1-epimerase